MLNRVTMIGRMTRDAELRTTGTGKSVASFSIAVGKRIKPQDGSPGADFFSVTVWGQSADFAANYLGKGRLVSIDGRLQQRRYTDKDGNVREAVEIVCDNIEGVDKKPDDNGGYNAPVGVDKRQVTKKSQAELDDYDPFADE